MSERNKILNEILWVIDQEFDGLAIKDCSEHRNYFLADEILRRIGDVRDYLYRMKDEK